MTIKQAVRIADGKLVVNDKIILTNVPENVVSTSSATAGTGIFVGVVFGHDNSRHVAPLGTLRDVRFLACFRFKMAWMAQKTGDKGSDIPLETQFMLLETKDDENNKTAYTVLLPLIESPFRTCIQGNATDELELCLESGDSETVGSTFTHSIYISYGMDPFLTIHEAISAVKLHLGTFKLRNEKKLPGIVDYFGWCTWDAFYQDVTEEGVVAGLISLKSGGTPPKFVIIDDGWQSVASDNNQPDQSKPGVLRLTGIKENSKFQKEASIGIKNIVTIAKEKHGLKYVYVWHAITGYWGGVRPGIEEYESVLQYPNLCKGVMENEPGWMSDAIVVQGVGLVNPRSVYKFYNEMHRYLSDAGVDGVKVDVQCILETLGGGHGGRVELTNQYHQALEASIATNFAENGCIACMSHNLDSLYCSRQTGIVRASDDFFPRDPMSHTIHIAAVAYNSVFLGEFMLPDWDMFHSDHPVAHYHGSARALSGGPVYVSDAPGQHNFDLLKKLVLPDGSILRALLPGRPTGDCLFSDPSRDGISLLKIWNMNKHTGVLGVYNCQGAAWNTLEKKNTFHKTNSEAINGHFKGSDVHLLYDVVQDSNWDGIVAIYSYQTGRITTLPLNVSIEVSLKVLEHEIFTIAPVQTFANGSKFAPLGLIDMFNSGGAIEGLKYDLRTESNVVGVVSLEIKGCGRFGAYSSNRPKKCLVGSSNINFEYDPTSGLLIVNFKNMPPEDYKVHNVEIQL